MKRIVAAAEALLAVLSPFIVFVVKITTKQKSSIVSVVISGSVAMTSQHDYVSHDIVSYDCRDNRR